MARKPNLSTATESDIRDAYRKHQAKLKLITCKLCETPFKQKRSWQAFCCDSCRVLFFRLKKAVDEAAWQEAAPNGESKEIT